MKARLFLGWLAALALLGCGPKSEPTPAGTNAAAAGGNPLNAPADYLGGLAKGQQDALKTVDTSSINKAIALFNVDQGRNPADLQELVQKKYLPQIPPVPTGMKLVYDATAGTVTVQKQ